MRSPKILIVRLSSLGDILHALPAFQALRNTFPDAAIDWVVEQRFHFLLDAVPGISRVHVVDTQSLKGRVQRDSWGRLAAVVRGLRARRYDFALDFQGLLKTALLTAASGATTRIGFPRALVRERPAHWFYNRHAGDGAPAHVVTLNRRLAEAAGASSGPAPVSLRIAAGDEAIVDSCLRREQLSDFVVINPGGGWPTKIWEPRRYGALARRIHTGLGLRAVVTTGPGEDDMFDAISAEAGEAAPVHMRLSFLQLVPLLRRASLMLAGDTGPFHLACLVGTPVVGIFGPTSPVRNGPWGDSDESVFRQLPCSSCHLRRCPTRNECMDIPVEEVFRAVSRRLSPPPSGNGKGRAN